MTTFFTIVTLALPLGMMAASAPSHAAGYQEGRINGYHSQVLESGSYDRPDHMLVFGPNGKEVIKVTCAPFDWESTGPNTSAFVDAIARRWCFD